jgi:hypothetical protein
MSHFEFAVGMRLHFCIFAALGGHRSRHCRTPRRSRDCSRTSRWRCLRSAASVSAN